MRELYKFRYVYFNELKLCFNMLILLISGINWLTHPFKRLKHKSSNTKLKWF